MSALIHITSSEQFQQEIAYNGLTIVDFYADRCGPCKMLSPIMEELQADNAAKGVKILKVNIDEQPKLTSDF
jgi:thiol-disulfide isomerase/thioredoxin